MAQTNYTPISLYYSATATNVPTAGNLVAGELAINTADGKLFYKDSSGVVQTLASKATGSVGGSTTQVQYNSSGSLAGSANLTFDGTSLTSGSFIPSSSTAPTNGVYLATTNSLAFSTASTERIRITSAGGVSFGATGTTYGTSGQVLTSQGNAPPTWTTVSSSSGFTGATTNAISSSALTLTSSSSQYQVLQINNASNSIVNLPDATTLSTKGFAPYVIENRSPVNYNLTIKDFSGNIIGYIPAGQIALIALKDNSTSAGVWNTTSQVSQTFVQWDANSVSSNTITASSTFLGIVGLSSTLFVRIWYIPTLGGSVTYQVFLQACTISGSTITYGTATSFTDSVGGGGLTSVVTYNFYTQTIRLSNTSFAIRRSYQVTDQPSTLASYVAQSVRICTVSGTTITIGSGNGLSFPSQNGTTVTDPNYDPVAKAYYINGTIVRLSDTSYAAIYTDSATTSYTYPYNYSGSLSCQVVTVSGTTQTVGAKVTLGSSTYSAVLSAAALSSTSLFVAYGQDSSAGSTTGRTKMNVVSISGTTPTWGTSVTIESSDTSNFLNSLGVVSNASLVYDAAVAPSSSQVVFNIGYGVAEGTVSGTTPTYDSLPSGSNIYPIYLATSTKAFGAKGNTGSYLNVATGGFFLTTGGINILPTTSGVTSPYIASPLGAQPTTLFIGYNNANTNVTLQGNTL